MRSVTLALALLVSFSFHLSAFAHDGKSEKTELPPLTDRIVGGCNAGLGGAAPKFSKEYDPELTQLGLLPRLAGWGPRGMLGILAPELDTSENQAALKKLGALNWSQKFYFVKSIEEALIQEEISAKAMYLHKPPEKREWNAHMRAVYIINPSIELKPVEPGVMDTTVNDIAAINRAILGGQIFMFNQDKTIVQIDQDLIKQTLKPDILNTYVYTEEEGTNARISGWFFPHDPSAVFMFANMNRSSKTIKDLEQIARSRAYPDGKNPNRPANERWTVTFNRDIEGIVSAAIHTSRKGQSQSRIEPKHLEVYRGFKEKGIAYSAEVWVESYDEQGNVTRKGFDFVDKKGNVHNLPGGIFGTFADGVLSIDSIAYPQGMPEVASVAMLATRDIMMPAQVMFSPAGMLSSWSASVKGEEVPGALVIELMENRNRDAKPDFDIEWAPEAPPEVRRRRFGPVDSKGRPIGKPIPDNRVSGARR